MAITEDQFCDVTQQYLDEVYDEAVALFRAGAAHDRCVSLALSIVEARDLAKLSAAQIEHASTLMLPPGFKH
jgi:hypothetical protein